MHFVFYPTRKRYSDDDMLKIVGWAKSAGILSHYDYYVNVYMYKVSNLDIIKHICALLQNNANINKELIVPPYELKINFDYVH